MDCKGKLPDALKDNPLAVFDEPPSPLGLATDCLESFISNTHSSMRSKQEARLSYEEQKVGSKALLWFFEPPEFKDGISVVQLPRFMRSVTFLMMAERVEQYLWDWVLLKEAPPYSEVSYKAHQSLHRGATL